MEKKKAKHQRRLGASSKDRKAAAVEEAKPVSNAGLQTDKARMENEGGASGKNFDESYERDIEVLRLQSAP